MSKFKKAIALLLVVALTAALSVSLTMAYLQHDVSDVNVMTLGNVQIEQLEQQRKVENGAWVSTGEKDEYGYIPDVLEKFEDNNPAYPAVYQDGNVKWDDRNGSQNASGDGSHQQSWGQVGAPGSNQLFDDSVKNVVDKFVFVKNTGRSDAYYRTIIAIECPEGLQDGLIHVNTNGHACFTWEDMGYATFGGVRYFLKVATYNYVLAPNEASRPSLLQVYLDPKTNNEDCKLFGDEWEIIAISQAVQTEGFADAATALKAAFGAVDATNAAQWVDAALEEAQKEKEPDTWDGTADTSWYNDTDTEFVIMTAEQLAGFSELVDGGNTFEGKTVKLGKNIDLYYLADGAEDPTCFDPIGSYRHDQIFKGTFDGQGYTIENMSQNTWALNTGYYYGDLGLGLFGYVEDASIKNLVMDNASISGESAICGTVAACAYGECTFENITVKNSKVADYQYYAGGIVGWASGNHKYINCNVDASTTIAAQWGDFDNSVGGVIGGCGESATILLKDCSVSCRIDAYNDVTSSYQWYAYRRCGMLIGNTGKTVTVENRTNAAAPQLTCENVTVTYDDWANYTYCEFAGKNWPYVRVQAGISNSAYSNPRYGHPTDANGNEVVDDNHVHNDGEDHFIECTFDQLYGGGQGVYGTATHDGVTVVYNNK